MDKIYRLLPWLDSKEALNFLHLLTGTKVTKKHLIELCFADHCAIYVDCKNIYGNNRTTGEALTGAGIGRITTRPSYYEHFTHKTLYADGACKAVSSVWIETETNDFVLIEDTECVFYFDDCENSRPLLFTPADIQALADKLNGTNIPSLEDLEKLSQQLEQERTARKATEAELKALQDQLYRAQGIADANRDARKETQAENEELRRQLESHKLAAMEMVLMRDSHKHYKEMLNRAMQAEAKVESLSKKLSELAGKQENTSEASSGISFPYSTKYLEAMREAAQKHWAKHDRSKPAPHGIQKAVQIILAERTGASARKLAELANAIKPDDLPKA